MKGIRTKGHTAKQNTARQNKVSRVYHKEEEKENKPRYEKDRVQNAGQSKPKTIKVCCQQNIKSLRDP